MKIEEKKIVVFDDVLVFTQNLIDQRDAQGQVFAFEKRNAFAQFFHLEILFLAVIRGADDRRNPVFFQIRIDGIEGIGKRAVDQ